MQGDLKDLEKQISRLNTYINSLKTWDDHAITMQARYDALIIRYNNLKEQHGSL